MCLTKTEQLIGTWISCFRPGRTSNQPRHLRTSYTAVDDVIAAPRISNLFIVYIYLLWITLAPRTVPERTETGFLLTPAIVPESVAKITSTVADHQTVLEFESQWGVKKTKKKQIRTPWSGSFVLPAFWSFLSRWTPMCPILVSVPIDRS